MYLECVSFGLIFNLKIYTTNMLTANVLCLKKKKKRTYSLTTVSNNKGFGAGTSKNERSQGGIVTMMQITEDTPPDMLAGAMDLTVHLPNGNAVKMSVERGTPMMDLLVQITTSNHLQLSNHTLQALGMAPSSEHSDKVLPFKPNTPIGALDTQHISVLPKGKTLPAPKYTAPGHQPFESTFRLKVHLPRNQLYVTRVSRNVLLEDIMKKVCEEKNLDPVKYDFKHPGNLDQVLDPKLTLSDYQITEIYVVAKGTTNLSQAFSAADIMVLRKEEERKQMHTKTGGGVFNLIFKRGKSSMGSGSVSSDNRSISPTHSDDSRSVTPPAVQAPPIVAPPKKDLPPDRPKPPQRKRRPAPKPPQIHVAKASNEDEAEKCSSAVNNGDPSKPSTQKSSENGLTICHSRNSSDSSGYHEASILSDHCANTSLPRTRPKSAFVGEQMQLQSTSNLNKMSLHSRSTNSLVAGRKKKAAPPPPPVPLSPANSVVAQSEKPSPLVASQSDISTHQDSSEVLETTISFNNNPVPIPRARTKVPKAPLRPRPHSDIYTTNKEYLPSTSSSIIGSDEEVLREVEKVIEEKLGIKGDEFKTELNRNLVEDIVTETFGHGLNSLHTIQASSEIKTELTSIYNESSQEEEKVTRASSEMNYNKKEETNIFRKIEEEIEQTENIQGEKDNTARESLTLDRSREISTDSKVPLNSNSKENMLEFYVGLPKNQPNIPENTDECIDSFRGTKQIALNDELSVQEMLTSIEVANHFSQTNNISNPTNTQTKENDNLTSSPKTTILNAQKSLVANIFTTGEFLKESKPPEVVGMIPKTPKEDKKFVCNISPLDKKRSFQIGNTYELDTASISSKRSGNSTSSINSVASALNTLDDEISDLDENMFTGSLSKGLTKKRPEVFNQLFGMHEYNVENSKQTLYRNISVESMSSINSVPGLNGARMKKWENTEKLDSNSLNYYDARNRWVTGDTSETESITSTNLTPAQTPCDNLPLCPLESSTPIRSQSEEKSLDSTDSGIAHDTQSNKDNDEEFGFYTPPPPPILDDIQQLDTAPVNVQDSVEPLASTNEIKELTSTSCNVHMDTVSDNVSHKSMETLSTRQDELVNPVTVHINKHQKSTSNHSVLGGIDWQYQLPSPPKAFRDSSPSNITTEESNSISDLKDSVVTSPELFEKLRSLEDIQSEKETVKSEVTSIASEEPLNMLSLEHLEKRKSLVYNRELATSLKMTDKLDTRAKTADNFTSSINTFQSTYDELSKNIVQQSQPRKPVRANVTSSQNHGLPNFKITTYDVPKQNITVFEDDTIRSNTHTSSTLTKNEIDMSMENISVNKKKIANELPSNEIHKEYKFYRPSTANLRTTSAMSRSGSFSSDQKLMLKPVSRSKSSLTLNKPQVVKMNESNISRSNSLFDVSGLQSLEVMKLIQNKLNTPQSSMENISFNEKSQIKIIPQNQSPKVETKETVPQKDPEPQSVDEKEQPPSPQPVKKYYYRGPPDVNMTTWSERPKVPVSVKEDEDYKLGNVNMSSKLMVNSTNNNMSSHNSIEIRNNGISRTTQHPNDFENQNFNVSVNGNEHVLQPSNNVVIKIGGTPSTNFSKNIETQRFVGPTAYRKPYSSINKNGSSPTATQRPHSIALSSDFNISRVPVVRSVEFKKPYKDFHGSNTSITQINHGGEDYRSLHSLEKSESFVEKYRSTENLRSFEKDESEPYKRVFRVGSFKPVDNHSAPVVKTFKSTNTDVNHRLSWNPSIMYNTLPTKPKEKEFTTNQHVPFSQSTLKRTASSKIYTADQNCNDIRKQTVFNNIKTFSEDNSYTSLPSTLGHKGKTAFTPPPPPPEMPQVTLRKVGSSEVKSQNNSLDARDVLLDSIRNFGGKKGLKAVKV